MPHRSYRVYYLAISLVMTIVVFYAFLFGGHVFVFTDYGSDTLNQYFPFYLHLADSIREGTAAAWIFNYGLGSNAASVQEWIFDPFTWVTVIPGLLVGSWIIKYSLLFAHFAQIYIAIALFDRYLRFFSISDKTRLVFSILYGFSGYMMMWGQHYFFGTAVIFFTALLLAIEYALQNHTWKASVIVLSIVACTLVFSVYFGFMSLLFCTVYTLLRAWYSLDQREKHSFLHRILPIAVSFALGILCSCIILIPVADFLLTGTARLSSDSTTLEKATAAFLSVQTNDLGVFLSRVLANNLSGDMLPARPGPTNCYEYPQFGIGIGAFLALSQYFVWLYGKRGSKNQFIVLVITAILVVFYCLDCLPTFVLYAFSTISWRTTFLFIPVLMLACAIGWDRVILARKTNMAALVVGLGTSLAVLVASFLYSGASGSTTGQIMSAAAALGCLVLFAIIATMRKATRADFVSRAANTCFAILLIACACDGTLTNSVRDTLTTNSAALVQDAYGDQTEAALDYIKSYDEGFYRIEKTYSDLSLYNDALAQDYCGISGYSSTESSGIQQFFRNLWRQTGNGAIGTHQAFSSDSNQVELATIMGVKYVISDRPLDYGWLEEVDELDGTYIYRNIYSYTIATEYYQTITKSDFNNLPIEERDKVLDDHLIINDDDSLAVTSSQSISEEEANRLSFENDSDFHRDNDAHIYGTINMNKNGSILLAIPYQKGWHITIDGQPVSIKKADYGFIAFRAPEGQHEVDATFTLPGLEQGILASAVGICLSLAWIVALKRKPL